ncbi:hypothetical protein KIPB_005190 [Kipferlia bialata]|uniref:Uncharacterized protein n=1 Tax=Kipferlia bialata TaxID=797122 RepID=A0A391NLA0_9EUKA|nr:hypothetical protein KIPB_005190 [Kipferlia bialata]|eukprot:g5190.t1
MRVDKHQLNRVLYGHVKAEAKPEPEEPVAEGLSANPTVEQLKKVSEIADEQKALQYKKDLDKAHVVSIESELPPVKDVFGQVQDALDKKENAISELPGDDKANLSSLKGLRDEMDMIVAEYNSIGRDRDHSMDWIRKKQNLLLEGRARPTLERISKVLPLFESTDAKDIAHKHMSVICLEMKAIKDSGPARKWNKALEYEARRLQGKIHELPEHNRPTSENKPKNPKQHKSREDPVEGRTPAQNSHHSTPPEESPEAEPEAQVEEASGIDITQILDYKEIAKHPKFEHYASRTTQELKEEITRLLTSPQNERKDASRLQKVIMVISLLKKRGLLSSKKLAKLMSHSNERFSSQLQ